MKHVALADVCTVIMGQAPDGETYNEDGNGLPLLAGAGDFDNGTPRPKKYTTARNVRTSEPGDVVIGIRASIGDKVLADKVYCLGRGVAGLRAGPHVEPRFLWHWVTHAAPTLASKGRGATFLQVNKNDIAELEMPLPPMEEQRRIASILDAADALRAQRRQALEKLDTLTQAIFIDMFGDPLNAGFGASVRTLPTRLGQLSRIRTGKLDANASSESGAFPFFTCAAEPLRIDEAAFDTKAVLVAGNGDLNVKYYEGKFNAYQRTYVIDSLDESVSHPRFLHGFLDIFVGRLRQQAIGGVIKYIKLGMLTEAEVSLPSVEEQHEYVKRVESANSARLLASRAQEQLESLFASLQHRAFRGEL